MVQLDSPWPNVATEQSEMWPVRLKNGILKFLFFHLNFNSHMWQEATNLDREVLELFSPSFTQMEATPS